MAAIIVHFGLFAVAAMFTLMGCDDAQNIVQQARTQAQQQWSNVQKEWSVVSNNPDVVKAKESVEASLRRAEAQVKNTRATAAHQWAGLSKNAREEINTNVHKLCHRFAKTTAHHGNFLIPPKCALAMAIGSGAVAASSGFALIGFGFASEGVELGSFAAMWQSTLGDVEADSLFARMQSLGAKGLSVEHHLVVAGAIATPAFIFCGVLDDVCHGCVSEDASADHASSQAASFGVHGPSMWSGVAGIAAGLLTFVGLGAYAAWQWQDKQSNLMVHLLN